MGQIFGTDMTSPRVIYDEEGDNGYVICGKYVPAELLAEILCYVDYKVLLNCQLVCKHWKILIQSYVWRKKAEMILGKPFSRDKDISWETFYLICKKKPFERNLVKNHSGQDGKKCWDIITQGGEFWTIEKPPVGVPMLPMTEPVFEGSQSCFVTSYYLCIKAQVIDLLKEGFTSYVLDNHQPDIEVGEWHSCRWDCPATYELHVELLGEENNVLDRYQLHDVINGERQNQWFHVSQTFTNYGPGLRKINFYHGGKDESFWAGHYGSKMAGAYVRIKVPSVRCHDEDDTTSISDE